MSIAPEPPNRELVRDYFEDGLLVEPDDSDGLAGDREPRNPLLPSTAGAIVVEFTHENIGD